MSKIIAVIIILIALVFTGAGKVNAQNISGESAWLKADQAQEYFDFRVENLRNFLQKYNSPLAPYAEEFVIYADKNDLDYRLDFDIVI
ncbi:MAG: hypothetical protein UU74_C0031G0002 [Candidatus Woesebacteria bacterium GW2011_GWA1_41_7]|uniref:Uncharacterized protein n=1 Tax=Candidatus Woesebacteria bacterium GW2011_GWA1_41_7 TaxID=1618556 RepID=A0A0G0Z474_9BACT|nr:MAG: hypothetical protein UU74_C0031G0002 [Candidatus Woesebacteria bacterium GW2011_GWA1_41_7]